MKKMLGVLLCAGALCGCQGNDATVSGQLATDADTLLVYASNDLGRSYDTDTVLVKEGKFSVNVADSTLRHVMIFGIKDGMINRSEQVEFFLLPGKPVDVKGDMKHYTLGGDKFYSDLNDFRQAGAQWQAKVDSMSNHFMELYNSGISPDSLSALGVAAQPQFDEYMSKVREAKLEYMKQHLNDDVALYAMLQFGIDEVDEAFGNLGEGVKTGALAPVYDMLKQNYDAEMQRRQAAELVKPGMPAPDFTLNDINGKPFALSSLKGKYVVLDFWGSWCGWCIKGMPDMKKAYKKYQKKMEIVGIDCNDPEDKWKEAVKQHELPWIHVQDSEEVRASRLYAVTGFPTKVIIDREGKIVKTVVGEDPEFYKLLDELMKK